MHDTGLYLIIAVVILALLFDYINGFHDTANAIATSISTKAMSPKVAILLAATMNLLGALSFTGVAKTIGKGIADPSTLTNGMWIVVAAMVSAIIWNLITWWYGIPSSSSHALIGSLTGAVIAAAGFSQINYSGFVSILESLVLSPIIALVLGFIIMLIFLWLFKNIAPAKMTRNFRTFQVLSAAFQAYLHGTNDAQKAMGIITFALVAGGFQATMDIPLWVKFAAAAAMALGTASGGMRIIRTVGRGIMKMQPVNGFAADVTSSIVIGVATYLKLPVSTTHVISSAIMGVGAAKGFNKVKWDVAGRIVTTWIITLPLTAVLAAIVYWVLGIFFY
ncbi:inorganic phosphate transporter [Tumebacillus flagellatus]|uniref:Inorganic phosphate transporter n=1 Tax=Tumebacillus flagellatus TaxID=1157490 RepID=A0A074LIX4_9BACL|nr:inorganic phosphate transporter [Tumebacillus flagellatus]KEO81074.1 inorganic phosphate transporter [Tumebacillus flagellatus]